MIPPSSPLGLDAASPELALCRSVFEAMSEGVIVVRQDGCLVAANEAASKQLGLGSADLPQPDFMERWPLMRADGVRYPAEEHPFRIAFSEGAPRQSLLLGFNRPDGVCRWLSCGLYPVPSPRSGEQRLLIVAFESLALQRQADIELRAVTDFSPVGVYLKDAQGNCLYVNRHWEELTGMRFAEAKNQGWVRLIHPDDVTGAAAAWEAAARTGETFYRDLRIVRPDGRVIWVSARAGRVDLADGALTGFAGTLTDISARKLAESALAASEQRLRACIETTPYVAVQWYDEQGRVVFWNSASELMFGWTAAEAMGKTLDQLIHTPEEARDFVELLKTFQISTEPHGPAEYQFRRKDGRSGVCLSTVFPIPAEDGQPRFVCMDVDISARRQSDRLVVGQHSILELIAMDTPMAKVLEQIVRFIEVNAPGVLGSILLLDADGVTLRLGAAPSLPGTYNRAVDGLRAGEGVGSCGTAVARRAPVVVEDILTDPLWDDFRPLAEAHGLRACWSAPIFSAHGEVLGTFACYHPAVHQPTREELRLVELAVSLVGTVVERDRAQSALRASEQRLRLLVDNSHDIVVELSLTGEIHYASANLSTHLGLAEQDLRAGVLLERIHPEDRVFVASVLRQPHGAATFRFQRGEGEWLWFEVWGRHFTATGGETRAVIFARDVTARKATDEAQARLETQLRQSQKLEAIGTLAGGVAHDFNNILAGILGHVELLSMDLPPGSPLTGSVQQIMRGTLRARDLVRQLLTFSRSKETRREPTRLGATVEEAMKLLRASLPSSIEFCITTPEEEPFIQADTGQLHQIIMNVCLNAAHAIGSRPGRLSVAVAVVELDESFTDGQPPLLPGRHVRLTVADNGCGMDAELRQRVFDPFFTTKPTGQGTGLGLAMVHGIVQMHQGAVTVTSEPGAGASFEFFFRAIEAAGPGPAQVDQRPPVGGGQRIMVVDDEEAVMWAARDFLTRLNYRVIGFQRSPEALEVFSQSPQDFDAVLTDLTMPQLGGLELARRMRALQPGLPVILMSGYLLGVEDRELRDAGVVHVVQKPFSVQGLADAVASALRAGK
ncbi:MAG: PAS domain S-box protein [Verrucomicrobia bacterium]|nr:PAS domain S-box protein [Verrucomicrobiota bacterium]